MNVNLFFKWLWIGKLLTFKTGPPCILRYGLALLFVYYVQKIKI